MIRFSVGYPTNGSRAFIDKIIERREYINEVYFAALGVASGRSSVSPDTDELPWESAERLHSDLARLRDNKIKLNLLLNGNCYGEDSLSRQFFLKLGDIVDCYLNRYGLSSVTTASPVIARFIHDNFAALEVRASVNLGIGDIRAMEFSATIYDGYYTARELNRDLATLRKMSEWCRSHGKRLYMLANSGCINNCPVRTFHDNLVAHESAIVRIDNAYTFKPLCREYLRAREHYVSLIRDMNFVRPEDIDLYDNLVDSVKLATRVNRCPERILDAYCDRHYRGALTDLLEPDNGVSLLPWIVDNSLLPDNFGEYVATCGHDCEGCRFCEEALERSMVRLEE